MNGRITVPVSWVPSKREPTRQTVDWDFQVPAPVSPVLTKLGVRIWVVRHTPPLHFDEPCSSTLSSALFLYCLCFSTVFVGCWVANTHAILAGRRLRSTVKTPKTFCSPNSRKKTWWVNLSTRRGLLPLRSLLGYTRSPPI